jgi:hypothetical protein
VHVANATAYFTSNHAAGPPTSQGKEPLESALFSMPLAGGDTTLLRDRFASQTATSDATSAYFAGVSLGEILVLTPPGTDAVTFNLNERARFWIGASLVRSAALGVGPPRVRPARAERAKPQEREWQHPVASATHPRPACHPAFWCSCHAAQRAPPCCRSRIRCS